MKKGNQINNENIQETVVKISDVKKEKKKKKKKKKKTTETSTSE